jgi:DNA repair exonuclease SbcCD ATPase subunit
MKRLSILFNVFVLISFIVSLQAQEKVVPKPVKEREFKYQVAEELPPPPPPAPVKLNEKDKEQLVQFYSAIDPEVEGNLLELKTMNPSDYEYQLQRMYREYIFLRRLEKEEPARYEEALALRRISVQAEKTAQTYHKSESDADRSQLKNELREILSKLFDLKEKERAAEVERIQERLSTLQREMTERRKNKVTIVENRLNQLLGKGYLYEW